MLVTYVIFICVIVMAVRLTFWLKKWNGYFTENMNDF